MPICCLPGFFSCWDFSKVIMPFLLSLLPAVQLAPILWNFTEVIPITIKSGAVEIDLE